MLRSVFVQVLSKTRGVSAAKVLGGPHAGAYRPPAVGVHGAVSAAHGLAATAGLQILMQGGGGGADGAQMGGVRHEKGHHPTAVQMVDQFEGVDAHLPAVLSVLDPVALDAHDGAQRYVRGQVATRPDARSTGLLEKPCTIAACACWPCRGCTRTTSLKE
jgi:hypothetical protein